MPVPVINPDKEGSAGVAILGVEDARPPSLSNFPRTFNPSAFSVWNKLISSPEYGRIRGNSRSTVKLWYDTIELYLSACNRAGVFPFQSSNQQSRNDIVVAHLRNLRLVMVGYFERCGFFQKVKIRQLNRRYHVEKDRFVIETEAMLYSFDDPTFRQWLQQLPYPRMLPCKEEPRTYERQLDYLNAPGVTVWCKASRKLVMSLGYTIVSPVTPVYPIAKRIPSNEQMATFVEESIWLPLVRSCKVKDAGSRPF